ncbi:hypothetical protein J6590_023835 [Homalodisca vitripennis]|nr:hypothetical protein J6590_023835 [Homalodisca vitripennis]
METIKEQVFGCFILLITHSTERILLKDADSVKMLPRRSDATLEEGDCSTILLILMPGCNLHLLSCSARSLFEKPQRIHTLEYRRTVEDLASALSFPGHPHMTRNPLWQTVRLVILAREETT